MDELWVSTSEGRFQVVNANGQNEDTVESLIIDYEAGAEARYKEYAKDAAIRRGNHPWSWKNLPPIPKAKFRHDARVTIDAALGITK